MDDVFGNAAPAAATVAESRADLGRPASASAPPAAETQWQLLALVRWFLALVVLAWHSGMQFGPAASFDLGAFDGQAAVLGFFVISGYSIAASWRERPEGFYRRRFLRIYPLYFLAVCGAQVAQWYLGPSVQGSGWKTTVGNLLLLEGLFCVPVSLNPAVWSVAVEAFFYLLAPVLGRWRASSLWVVAALTFCLFVADRAGWVTAGSLYGGDHAKWLWAWVLGFLAHRERSAGARWALVAAGLSLAWPRLEYTRWSPVTFFLVVAAVAWRPKVALPRRLGRVFRYLGDISYPLYLFHMVGLSLAFHRFPEVNSSLRIAAVLVVTLFFHHVVDGSLKRRFVSAPVGKAEAWLKRRLADLTGKARPTATRA